MKKYFCIVLAMLLLLTIGISAPAKEETLIDYITDGGFEEGVIGTTYKAWNATADVITDERAHSGKLSAKMKGTPGADDQHKLISQYVNVVPESEYTLNYSVFRGSDDGRAVIKIEYYTMDEKNISVSARDADNITLQDLPVGRWHEGTLKISTEGGVNRMLIYFRMRNGGEFYWDDIQLLGAPVPDKEPITNPDVLEAFEGAENMLINPGFETLDANGNAADWLAYKEWGTYASVDNQVKYEGNNSIRLQTTTGGNPWICQKVDVKPCTTYQLTLWTRTESMRRGNDRGFRFKFEFYDKETNAYVGDAVSDELTPRQTHRWEQQEALFVTPSNCNYVAIYYRMRSPVGDVWFDDVTLCPVSKSDKIALETDLYFYYPDMEEGYAEAVVPYTLAEMYKDATVDFQYLSYDKTTVLKETLQVPLNEAKAYFSFPIEPMKSKQKTEFFVTATLKDKDGNVVDTSETDVYCYPRPALLDENGIRYSEDGTPFNGTLGYHVGSSKQAAAREVGITLTQMGFGAARVYLTDPETAKNQLDDLASRGQKGIVCLYPNMQSAGHPDNIEATKKMVADLKDHPGVYGWATMDEPSGQIEIPDYWLKISYKAIRDIDDNHPVFVMCVSTEKAREMQGALTHGLKWETKFCDAIGVDPYSSSNRDRSIYPGQAAVMTRNISERYTKPFFVLNQCFSYGGYVPTTVDLRSSWYQALIEGAYGQGWYHFTGDDGIESVKEYWDYLSEFNKEEQDVSYDLFGRAATSVHYNQIDTADYAYKSVVKDGDLYTVVFNRHAEEAQNVEVSLKSFNGLVTASGTVEELYGEGANPTVSADGTSMTVTIAPAACVLIKIGGANIDKAALEAASFDDTTAFAWAQEAIESVYREGHMDARSDRAFDPATPVTRGEFAKAIIRTLDIMWGERLLDENFSDVPVGADYAREVCIGKTIGLFRGTGDDKFNPDAPISRQDLMVMCERALHYEMRMGGETADGTTFTDSETIADYAKTSVLQMVAAGIVKGNADGSVNPLGNATRAETAVIMYRIANM